MEEKEIKEETKKEENKKRKYLIILILFLLLISIIGISITYGKDIYESIENQIIETLKLNKTTSPEIEEQTKTISTTCTSETPTANCSKQGNGYAKITYIGE